MTLVTGRIMLPYGTGGETGADGSVCFSSSSLYSRAGAIYTPGVVKTEISGGVMAPVELTPGIWAVTLTIAGRHYGLPPLVVEGEEITLTASELPGDGTYSLTLDKNQAITHIGDGSYEIGEA